jgi:hypothetical protein
LGKYRRGERNGKISWEDRKGKENRKREMASTDSTLPLKSEVDTTHVFLDSSDTSGKVGIL